MSKEFIEAQYNNKFILKAARQERQLAYFTLSDIQEDYLTNEYLQAWAESKYQGKDYFLNYVKSVFKVNNFLTFFKYLRKPLPSAKLINNKIAPQLRRIFNAENAEFKYSVQGLTDIDYSDMLNIKDFEKDLFNRMLFKHNSLLVSGIIENEPYRYFVDISSVKSIKSTYDGKIKAIAFEGVVDEIGEGYIYVDETKYSFFDKDFNEHDVFEHNLGRCPVHFISPKIIGDNWIIRESIFTYIREELEEYVFLKTLQKMTDPNGAIPIVTQLDVEIEEKGDIDSGTEPADNNMMSSQRANIYSTNPPQSDSVLQAGTVFKIPPIETDDGSIDMEAVRNFINFHYIPVEALNYLRERINEIEHSIVYTIIGGVIDGLKEGSKNELQVEESLSVLQNTLIYFSDSFNYIRKLSDEDMLRLKYGNRVMDISIFYGSDFFLDTESMLYENLSRSINPIERKSILIRINQNRYKGNEHKLNRQTILYDLIPYISDQEFEIALNAGKVSDEIFEYQTRFNYWISQFESLYDDIVSFYKMIDGQPAAKMKVINDLILNIINQSKKIKET
jgi:hypothetical protein